MRKVLCILLLCCFQLAQAEETGRAIADSVSAGALAVDSLAAKSGQLTADTLSSDTVKKESKYSKWIADVMGEKKELPLFQGFTVSFDVLGLGMLAITDYGTIEGALRLSLKNTFLPIVELGYGICDMQDYNTKISYKVNAPFFRLGCDWNFLRNKFQDNRMFIGLRWGFSTYKYDMSGPMKTDPVFGGAGAFDFSGTTSTSNWVEFVLGCQVKIVKNFHMGWSLRLKYHIHSSQNDNSKAYYIPGYGTTTNSNTWSGSYNLIFDLNWGKKRK